MVNDKIEIGVIGGSGLYDIEGLSEVREVSIDTPFGPPSDPFITGRLNGRSVAFLPRHGKGHRHTPTEVNYRANIYGFKKLGVGAILSVSAVGSLAEEIEPGHIVIPDQYIDRTRNRISTFFSGGIVGHVQFADPVCPITAGILGDCAEAAGAKVHRGGTYICMEGPAFSSRAESKLYRSWGASVIGMTNLPEAKLAREAEICYASVALATDYDCWHPDHDDVDINDILKIMAKNVAVAKKTLATAITDFPAQRECGCGKSLEFAIITDPKLIPEQTKKNLAPIIGRVIKY